LAHFGSGTSTDGVSINMKIMLKPILLIGFIICLLSHQYVVLVGPEKESYSTYSIMNILNMF